MVMGGESFSEGQGFKSKHRILYAWIFFTLVCCKNCVDVCLKKDHSI